MTERLYEMIIAARNKPQQNSLIEEHKLLSAGRLSACFAIGLSNQIKEYKTQINVEHKRAQTIFVKDDLEMKSFHSTTNIYKCVYSNEDIQAVKQIKQNLSIIESNIKDYTKGLSSLCKIVNDINYNNDGFKTEELDIYADNIMYVWQEIVGYFDIIHTWRDRISCYINLMNAYKIAQTSLAKYKCDPNYSFLNRLNIIVCVHVKIVSFDYTMKKNYQRLIDICAVNQFSNDFQTDQCNNCSVKSRELAANNIMNIISSK